MFESEIADEELTLGQVLLRRLEEEPVEREAQKSTERVRALAFVPRGVIHTFRLPHPDVLEPGPGSTR